MIINGTHAAVPPTGTGTGTNGTGGAGSAGGAAGTGGTGSTPATTGTTLGGTDFLTLMLAQLKNQDPTSPVDSNTFLSQLAQLSEVQGITSLNTSFSSLSSSLSSSQALQASSLLGHQALVNGSTAATTLVNGTVESVSMGAGSTGLTLNVAGIGSVPFSSVQQISN